MNLEKCLRLIKSKGFYTTLEFSAVDGTRRYEVYADRIPKSLCLLDFRKLGVIILDDNILDVLFKIRVNDSDKDVKDVIELLQCKYLFSNCYYSYFKCCIGDEND